MISPVSESSTAEETGSRDPEPNESAGLRLLCCELDDLALGDFDCDALADAAPGAVAPVGLLVFTAGFLAMFA